MILINSIIFILVFLFVIYRIGIILGHFLKNENKINNFLYGFLLMVGVNQILLTPCIFLHTSFKIAFDLVMVIDILLLIVSFFINDSIMYKKQKGKDIITIIMCILIGFQMIFSTVNGTSNPDDSFYVSLSTASIDSNSIYIEEPSMGYTGEKTLLSITEQIPTIELQIAIWSKISNINPAALCHSILPMLLIFLSYIAFYYFAQSFFEQKSSKVFLIFISIIFMFTAFTTKFRTGCLLIKCWQGKAMFLNIAVPMIIGTLIRIDEKVKKTNVILLVILNLFSMSLTSTAIFLIPFIYMPFGLLKLIKVKWKDILSLLLSCIPALIYILIYIILNQNVEEAFAVPRDEVNIIESLKSYQSTVYLIYYLISTIIIMFIGSKKAKRYYGYVQLINLLTIWNPIFSNFIAKYFTSSAIFWRVFWILPIEFSIAYSLTRILERINNRNIKIFFVIISILILIIPGKFVYSFDFAKNLENISEDVLQQINYILEQSENDDEIVIMTPPDPETHGWTIRQVNAKIKLIYSRYLYIGKLKNEEEITNRIKLNQLYYGNSDCSITEFNKLAEQLKIDWVIVNSENTKMLEYMEQTNMQKKQEIAQYILYSNMR